MKNNKIFVPGIILLLTFALGFGAINPDEEIYLIVRGDDIGSSHAANVGCIEAYKNGIARTVEVMVPCPWFPEAVEMLKQHPGLDVGVHLTLTSEWEGYKWGPLTCAPSLVDSNGYFYPRQKDWVNEKAQAFWNAEPNMQEVEQELRAQIEMALKHIPRISHLTGHMGIASPSVSPKMTKLVDTLAKEYELNIDPEDYEVKRANDYYPGESDKKESEEDRQTKFIEMLKNLKPGIYLYVEHPGTNTPELQALGHEGNNDVAEKRAEVTEIFTSEKVREIIEKRNINLISYKDLKKLNRE